MGPNDQAWTGENHALVHPPRELVPLGRRSRDRGSPSGRRTDSLLCDFRSVSRSSIAVIPSCTFVSKPMCAGQRQAALLGFLALKSAILLVS